jgi:quinol monooxygenase YgiN
MLIAHVHFTVQPAERQRALDALLAEVPTVRAMKGCLAFHPFLDASDETGLGIVHEWTDEASFGAYVTSVGFAEVGKVLRPMMIAAPVSKRFDAKLLETVN